MKKTNTRLLPFAFSACCLLLPIVGCVKGKLNGYHLETYTLYTPIYQLKQSVLDHINGSPTEPIDSSGKIFIINQYIFLNDVDKGIHIIDNTDPVHPVQTAFLQIPGNQDMVVKGNTLYADMYSDLLAIDITDLHRVKINSMIPALFVDRENVNGFSMDSNTVIINWIKKDTTVILPNHTGVYNPNFFGPIAASFSNNSTGQTTGIAGSSAKMVLINNYIYAITERHELGAIDLSSPTAPVVVSNQFAGYDLETIFPFKDHLFLGSDIGTFIYDISDPGNPKPDGEFTHGQACDPVITDGTFAYITLHTGTSCGGASNELDVVDVRNLQQPDLVKSYPMISPKGLSKDGNLLFVCDGPSEVKLFDAGNPGDLLSLSTLRVNGPSDVIASQGDLMVVASDGLYQFDYKSINNLRLLSFFPLK
jgi:hypothetical protein